MYASRWSSQSQLTTARATDVNPVWSPDGARIAFETTATATGKSTSWRRDGSEQTAVSNDPAQDSEPEWSPDSRFIAFTSFRNGTYDVYAMSPNGSGQTRLTDNAASDGGPSWGITPAPVTPPANTLIAFQSERDGNREIYVMNPDGTAQTRLTTADEFDGFPSWSPDGQQIVFESRRDDGNSELYVMNADGSNQLRLTNSPAVRWWPLGLVARRGSYRLHQWSGTTSRTRSM